MVRGGRTSDKSQLGRLFARIETCRLFVYQVRNNVFHGTKTLGKIWDTKQSRRIEVYNRRYPK